MKYLIFDAGPIISLTMNGMLPVLEKLKGVSPNVTFILTPAVKRELVDKPMGIKKYKLEAMMVQDFIDRGIFVMSKKVISDAQLAKERQRILKAANGVLRATNTGEKIQIIHEGEASCLAFSNLCGCDNVIVIDERTTRMLTEAPKSLEKMMESKLHTPLDSNLSLVSGLKKFRFIRSVELLYVAWKKGLVGVSSKGRGVRDKDWLDALLYGMKFKGCAVSSAEIETMKKI